MGLFTLSVIYFGPTCPEVQRLVHMKSLALRISCEHKKASSRLQEDKSFNKIRLIAPVRF